MELPDTVTLEKAGVPTHPGLRDEFAPRRRAESQGPRMEEVSPSSCPNRTPKTIRTRSPARRLPRRRDPGGVDEAAGEIAERRHLPISEGASAGSRSRSVPRKGCILFFFFELVDGRRPCSVKGPKFDGSSNGSASGLASRPSTITSRAGLDCSLPIVPPTPEGVEGCWVTDRSAMKEIGADAARATAHHDASRSSG